MTCKPRRLGGPYAVTRSAVLASLALSVAANAARAEPMQLPQYIAGMKTAHADARVTYGPASQQWADVYQPKTPGLHPVVVMLHGGCFSNDVPAVTMSALAADLAQHGVAVWNVEYRRVGDPGGGFPGMWQDVGSAIDRLRAEAPARDFDLSRVVAVGHSSGAVLGLWAAGRAKLPKTSPLYVADPLKLSAVVAIAGLGDLKGFTPLLPWICGDDVKVSAIVGEKTVERPDPYADTSPRALLPTGTPTLAFAGTYDAQLPPYMSLYWRMAARKAGDPAETALVPDASHFDLVAVQSPAWPIERQMILDKVASLKPGAAK